MFVQRAAQAATMLCRQHTQVPSGMLSQRGAGAGSRLLQPLQPCFKWHKDARGPMLIVSTPPCKCSPASEAGALPATLATLPACCACSGGRHTTAMLQPCSSEAPSSSPQLASSTSTLLLQSLSPPASRIADCCSCSQPLSIGSVRQSFADMRPSTAATSSSVACTEQPGQQGLPPTS